jgi:uncharacterized protein YfaS (alpha-2-macroglobulin family)
LNVAWNADLKFDQAIMNKGVKYLTRVLNHDQWPSWYGSRARLSTRAYITAVLSEAGRPVAPLVENLYMSRDDLSSFDLALLLTVLLRSGGEGAAAGQIEEVKNRLFGRAVITSGEVHFEEAAGAGGLFSSKIRTSAAALRAILLVEPNNPHLVPMARWLVQSRREGHWGNTHNNAWVLLALTDYARLMETASPRFSVLAALDLQPLAEADFSGIDAPPLIREVPVGEMKIGRRMRLELNLEGEGEAYYTLRLNHAPQEPDLDPRQAGFALTRTYSPADGRSLPSGETPTFKRGDLVKVEVTLLVPSTRHWVALEDRLPAGLEPINFRLPSAPRQVKELLDRGHKLEEYYRRYWYEHREIRHDRVAVFARVLGEGAYTFSYLARAVTPGRFIAPGPKAEEMYSPEVFGRGNGTYVHVVKD